MPFNKSNYQYTHLKILPLSSPLLLFGQNTIGVIDFVDLVIPPSFIVYLLDMCGEVVHTWTNADTLRPGNVAYLQENGDITAHKSSPTNFWWNEERGTTLWSYTLNDSTGRLHHDIEVKPNVNLLNLDDSSLVGTSFPILRPTLCLSI